VFGFACLLPAFQIANGSKVYLKGLPWSVIYNFKIPKIMLTTINSLLTSLDLLKFMLRIITSKSADQAKKYYHEGLSREGYYSEGQELPGQWFGKAARRLGLHGRVGQEFNRMCDNLHPETGEQLTPRTKDNRRCGYDFNFHVPKPVTLAYQWGDDRILPAFKKAVRETMEEIEREASTRVRSGGRDEDRQTGNLVWSEFIHQTARPVDGIPDPHLHAHCYVFNTTFDPVENRWKAAQFGGIKHDAGYFQAAFLSRLATGLTELGYQIERSENSNSFEIAGIARSLCEKFSRRSTLVKKKAKELGIDTHAGEDGLAARTREKKNKGQTVTELKPIWWSRLTPTEVAALDNVKTSALRATIIEAAQSAGVSPARVAVDLAIKHVFERQSVISERNLITEALQWSYGVAKLKAIQEAVKEVPIIRVLRDGETFVTTEEVRAEEGRLIDRCKLGQEKFAALNAPWRIQDTALNAAQQAGALHVLRSHDFITGIEGKAGVGKTRLLHEIRRGVEQSGHKLLVLTPMAITAHDTMPKDGFKDAQTVAKLLDSEQVQFEAQGAVWLVDEAGLLSCRTLDKLTALAGRLNARLVLVGDTKQHHAVERGQAFALLQNTANCRWRRWMKSSGKKARTKKRWNKSRPAILKGPLPRWKKWEPSANCPKRNGNRRWRWIIRRWPGKAKAPWSSPRLTPNVRTSPPPSARRSRNMAKSRTAERGTFSATFP
jgi:conjugative relaxase-like TrwC/TraI family protein